MQIEIQIPKAVLFDTKYTVEQATNFSTTVLGMFLMPLSLFQPHFPLSSDSRRIADKKGIYKRFFLRPSFSPNVH